MGASSKRRMFKGKGKNMSALKRNLEASKICQEYRLKFNVPDTEKLDGRVECYLHTPYDKQNRNGKLYLR